MTERCRCGTALPAVPDDETPYEFCSAACRLEALELELHVAQVRLAIVKRQRNVMAAQIMSMIEAEKVSHVFTACARG